MLGTLVLLSISLQTSSCARDRPAREEVSNHMWKGGGGRAIFPRIWGFGRAFFPAFIGPECSDRLTTGTGPAPSPTLPLPGEAKSLRFPPSSQLHSSPYKRKGKTAPCTGRWPTVSWQLHCTVLFPIVPTQTHAHTHTHTPTESGFPSGKINKCKLSLHRFIPPWSWVSFLLVLAKSRAAPVLPGPAVCSGGLGKGMMCCAEVGRVPYRIRPAINRFCLCDGQDTWESEGGSKEELGGDRGKQGLLNPKAICG